MKKSLLTLFMSMFLLVGCSNAGDDKDKNSSSNNSSNVNPSVTTEYSQEELKTMFKQEFIYFNSEVKNKDKFRINATLKAPDAESTGMYQYKIHADADTNVDKIKPLDGPTPYMKLDADVYPIIDNKPSLESSSSMHLIRLPELNPVGSVTDYILESDGTYSRTIDTAETGGYVVYVALVKMIVDTLKEFSYEDLPHNVYYTYEDGLYTMQFKFKDLEGTKIDEYLNLMLGMFPEMNEQIAPYKDEVIFHVTDINFDLKNTKFNVNLEYPIMGGAMPFNVIESKFDVKYNLGSADKVDVSKLNVSKTYYHAKKGANTLSLREETVDGTTTYVGSLVLTAKMGIDISSLQNLQSIGKKVFEIKDPDALSFTYIDRFTGKELKFANNQVPLDLLDMILLEARYQNNGVHTINISEVANV